MHAQSLLLGEKMSAHGKPASGSTRILTDSARKRNSKEALVESRQTTFYTHVLKVHINFQCKKITKLTGNIPLNNTSITNHYLL